MLESIAEAIISQTGAVGAMLMLTATAVVGLWRANVRANDRFIEQVERTNEKLVEHLKQSHAEDLKTREAHTGILTMLVERVTQIGVDVREHDRHMTIMALGARPVGGSEPGEDLSQDDRRA